MAAKKYTIEPRPRGQKAETMKKIESDPDELFPFHFKVSHRHYEYLKRLARATPRGTMQRILNVRVYPRDWRTELEQLRDAQRKLGIKDREFFHPSILKRMGIDVKPGRNARPYGRRKKTKSAG